MRGRFTNLTVSVFAVLLVSQPMAGQVGAGTLIAVHVLKDKILMAADSRTSFLIKPPEDNHCKIAAFRHQLIVGVSGAAFYPDPAFKWDAIDEARAAAATVDMSRTIDATKRADAFADAWANRMKAIWELMNRDRRELVRALVDREGPTLTMGFFGAAAQGSVILTGRAIGISADNRVIIVPQDVTICSSVPCGSGEMRVFNEYVYKTSQRAKDESWVFPPALLKRTGPEMLKLVKLIELTIADNPNGPVGGLSMHWSYAQRVAFIGIDEKTTAQRIRTKRRRCGKVAAESVRGSLAPRGRGLGATSRVHSYVQRDAPPALGGRGFSH